MIVVRCYKEIVPGFACDTVGQIAAGKTSDWTCRTLIIINGWRCCVGVFP